MIAAPAPRPLQESSSDFKLKKPGALLYLLFALCGCSKFAAQQPVAQPPEVRAPAPWNGYDLRLQIGTPSGGGGETMDVFEGSTSSESSSAGATFTAGASFRVDKVTDTGVMLEVDIRGSKLDANKNNNLPFHLKQTVLVPYQGDASLPIMDDLVLNARFVPNPARVK